MHKFIFKLKNKRKKGEKPSYTKFAYASGFYKENKGEHTFKISRVRVIGSKLDIFNKIFDNKLPFTVEVFNFINNEYNSLGDIHGVCVFGITLSCSDFGTPEQGYLLRTFNDIDSMFKDKGLKNEAFNRTS